MHSGFRLKPRYKLWRSVMKRMKCTRRKEVTFSANELEIVVRRAISVELKPGIFLVREIKMRKERSHSYANT